jgi:RNA polymerase sigma-70 factor (ECF subfamily)
MTHSHDGRSAGSTSTSLLIRVQSRDPEAWRRLVALYGPLVHSWCLRAGLQPDDLADVFQEVFTAVAGNIGSFSRNLGRQRGEPDSDQKTAAGDGRLCGSFRAWLYTITRNKLHDFYRRRAIQPQAAGGSTVHRWLSQLPDALGLDEAGLDEPGPHDAALARRALDLIQSDFEEKTWQAFLRVAIDGLSPREAGLELGMSAVAVRKAKSRVLRRLREEFGDLVDLG